MKKLSRKSKAILLIIAAVCMILFLYNGLGCPFLSPRHALRVVENRSLIGPTKILGTEEINIAGSERMIVSKDAYFGCIMAYDFSMGNQYYCFRYRELENGLALMIFPDDYSFGHGSFEVPVILFDNCEEAVRADVSITADMTVSRERFYKVYELSATRKNPGYFRFNINFKTESPYDIGTEGIVMERMTGITSDYWDVSETAIPITVKFYDDQDNLIREEAFEIKSTGAKYNFGINGPY